MGKGAASASGLFMNKLLTWRPSTLFVRKESKSIAGIRETFISAFSLAAYETI